MTADIRSENPAPVHSSVRVSADSLELWRGDRCLFSELSFSLRAPVLHVKGANGSGKTTLLKVLCGLTSAERGRVNWTRDTLPVSSLQMRGLMAYAGHQDALNPGLTVTENLEWGVGLYRPVGRADIERGMESHDLQHLLMLPAGKLSAGQKRRVALMRTVLSATPVWIWDEPYANLDTAGVDWVNALIAEHIDRGGCLILSAHQSPGVDGALVQELELIS